MEESPTESPVESVETTGADDAANYMVSEWAGVPQYICIDCGHQTWDLDGTQDHQTRMHFRVMRALTIDRPAATPEAGAVGTPPGAEASETPAAGQESEAPAAPEAPSEGRA